MGNDKKKGMQKIMSLTNKVCDSQFTKQKRFLRKPYIFISGSAKETSTQTNALNFSRHHLTNNQNHNLLYKKKPRGCFLPKQQINCLKKQRFQNLKVFAIQDPKKIDLITSTVTPVPGTNPYSDKSNESVIWLITEKSRKNIPLTPEDVDDLKIFPLVELNKFQQENEGFYSKIEFTKQGDIVAVEMEMQHISSNNHNAIPLVLTQSLSFYCVIYDLTNSSTEEEICNLIKKKIWDNIFFSGMNSNVSLNAIKIYIVYPTARKTSVYTTAYKGTGQLDPILHPVKFLGHVIAVSSKNVRGVGFAKRRCIYYPLLRPRYWPQ